MSLSHRMGRLMPWNYSHPQYILCEQEINIFVLSYNLQLLPFTAQPSYAGR